MPAGRHGYRMQVVWIPVGRCANAAPGALPPPPETRLIPLGQCSSERYVHYWRGSISVDTSPSTITEESWRSHP